MYRINSVFAPFSSQVLGEGPKGAIWALPLRNVQKRHKVLGRQHGVGAIGWKKVVVEWVLRTHFTHYSGAAGTRVHAQTGSRRRVCQ